MKLNQSSGSEGDSNPRSSVSKTAGAASSRALGVDVSLVELSCCFGGSASSIGSEFRADDEVGARLLVLGASCCEAGGSVFCGPFGRRSRAESVSSIC